MHQNDVAEYNAAFMRKLVLPEEIFTVAVFSDASPNPDLQDSLKSPHFHQLTSIDAVFYSSQFCMNL